MESARDRASIATFPAVPGTCDGMPARNSTQERVTCREKDDEQARG